MSFDLVDSLVGHEHAVGSPVLYLFGGPMVTMSSGQRMAVPEGSKRLLVFVALHRGQVERKYAAGTLWPIGDDERAAGNLRSALWRLNRAKIDVLAADKRSLSLRRDVVIDLRLISEWAARLIAGQATAADLAVLPAGIDALDLLPGWYDDWVLLERERVRQRLLHALEALSLEHLRVGRCAQAVEAAMLAVNAEPLRESAQRVLLMAHLGERNWTEAVRAYDTYRCLLRRELDVEPGPELAMLLEAADRRPSRAGRLTPQRSTVLAAPGAGAMARAT
ncbi:AfsR/SARP family transcriptional regulator [Actinopolymorpha pittospori]